MLACLLQLKSLDRVHNSLFNMDNTIFLLTSKARATVRGSNRNRELSPLPPNFKGLCLPIFDTCSIFRDTDPGDVFTS